MNGRVPRIDALRGLAVFGIMLVNIWGFVYGYGLNTYPAEGVLDAADQAAIFISSAFAEQKFYPIFSLLFGAGFALQTGGARPSGPALDAIKVAYRRRLTWLLGCGLLHAGLLWFGDILVAYALAGFWLSTLIGARPAKLLKDFKILIAINIVAIAVTAWMYLDMAGSSSKDLVAQVDELKRVHAVYSLGSWKTIAIQRLLDYLGNAGSYFITLPRVALLFMCGVLAVRLGWITRPQRHRRAWKMTILIGLGLGIPLNLLWGGVAVASAIDPLGTVYAYSVGMVMMEIAGPMQAAGYVSLFMLAGPGVLKILEPVGRMALTNYLMQSLLLMLLLQGFGLGLGAGQPRAGLIGMAAAVALFQLLFSHWWLSTHKQGPMEALWRSYSR